MTGKIILLMSIFYVALVQAQYSNEWTSANLGQYGYGGAYGYDIDNDGLVEYYVRQANQITFYNGNYTVEWNISVPGYDYVSVLNPRDIDGDGISIPLNTDNDAAGEVIITAYYYNSGNYTYYGKFRVYDAVTRVLEHESAQITGFYGSACQEDIDGDGRDEIILNRFGGSSTSYVDVYAYTGAGTRDGQAYTVTHELTTIPNPSTRGTTVAFTIAVYERGIPVKVAVHDISGRYIRTLYETENAVPGAYELLWDGRDTNDVPVSSGTYFIRITKGSNTESGQVQIVQ